MNLLVMALALPEGTTIHFIGQNADDYACDRMRLVFSHNNLPVLPEGYHPASYDILTNPTTGARTWDAGDDDSVFSPGLGSPAT